MRLSGTRILLGVTGGIAAYKSAYLIRLLVKEGATVQVVMTPAARAFIGPVTLSTLSNRPVIIDFFDAENGQWSNHVELGLWPDLFLIAPLTAHSLAAMRTGAADNILLATYLSARCPVMLAPAMDLDMWTHQTTRQNMQTMADRQHHIVEPETGELASGLSGKGRMAEPEAILSAVTELLGRHNMPLYGKKVLITAGPTYEMIDPVRFIGNFSTGKMGFALADELFRQGAEVQVVHGPVQVATNELPYTSIPVLSALEMLAAAEPLFDSADIFIATAAVADFRPKEQHMEKMKKADLPTTGVVLELEKNPDILATLSVRKRPHQMVGGFALESTDGVENAQKKLTEKNLDFIVLNSLQDQGAGFAHNTNKVTIMDRSNKFLSFELKDKKEVARDIVTYIIEAIHA